MKLDLFVRSLQRRLDPRSAAKMSKLPWKPTRPPKKDVDWPMRFLVGGCVVAAAIIVGLLLSNLINP